MAKAFWLPNDNRIIWAGNVASLDDDSEPIENILILAGGDILFFHTPAKLSTNKPTIIKDIKNLKYVDFKEKYGINIDYNTWNFLINELDANKIPPYKYKFKIKEYSSMINNYLSNIERYVDDGIKYEEFIAIIKIIVNKMGKLKVKSIKEKIKIFNKLIMDLEKT